MFNILSINSLLEPHVKRNEEKKTGDSIEQLHCSLKICRCRIEKLKVSINFCSFCVFFCRKKKNLIYCSIDGCVNQIITVIYFVARRVHCQVFDNTFLCGSKLAVLSIDCPGVYYLERKIFFNLYRVSQQTEEEENS